MTIDWPEENIPPTNDLMESAYTIVITIIMSEPSVPNEILIALSKEISGYATLLIGHFLDWGHLHYFLALYRLGCWRRMAAD
ncbi:hypothetical protein ANRL3_02824 [Anaerolineae bacterium]|nr:hypothetical protein ANRL3_02824 [Anaerolineae bacterium]